jgi:hypothetical protein
MKILDRPPEHLEVSPTTWADILLLSSQWGWQPSHSTINLMGNGVEVSASDACSLSAVIDRILAKALLDPMHFYPVRADMGMLSQVGDFCRDGGFTIR